MKVSLLVLTPGKMQGKVIPITGPNFLIGRDAECHLRPASPLISKKHCAIVRKGNAIIVRDYGSTNGTLLNDQKVTGEAECGDSDVLKLGPLEFRVQVEISAPTPPPRPSTVAEDDDAAAAMLLSLGDENGTPATTDSQGVPMGSTVMEVVRLPGQEGNTPPEGQAPVDPNAKPDRMSAAKEQQASTSSAAKAILDKYLRRRG